MGDRVDLVGPAPAGHRVADVADLEWPHPRMRHELGEVRRVAGHQVVDGEDACGPARAGRRPPSGR